MKVCKLENNVLSKNVLLRPQKTQINFKAETAPYSNATQSDTLNLNKDEKSKKLSKGAIAAITIGTILGTIAIAVPTSAAILRKNKWKDVDLENKELGGFKKGMCKMGDSINNGLSKLFGKTKDKK